MKVSFAFFGVLLLFTVSMLLTVKHFPNSLYISCMWKCFIDKVIKLYSRYYTWMLSQTCPVSRLCLLKVQARTRSRTVMFSSPETYIVERFDIVSIRNFNRQWRRFQWRKTPWTLNAYDLIHYPGTHSVCFAHLSVKVHIYLKENRYQVDRWSLQERWSAQ